MTGNVYITHACGHSCCLDIHLKSENARARSRARQLCIMSTGTLNSGLTINRLDCFNSSKLGKLSRSRGEGDTVRIPRVLQPD